jgi:hypothetical protein
MNNPNHDLEIGMDDDQQSDADPHFDSFVSKARRIWQTADASNPNESAGEVRALFLRALADWANDNNGDEEDDSHTDGPEIRRHKLPNTQGRGIGFDELESDAMGLLGCTILPRKMSREELQAAADRLVGPRTVEDDILEAIKRREGKNLMGQHENYHQ